MGGIRRYPSRTERSNLSEKQKKWFDVRWNYDDRNGKLVLMHLLDGRELFEVASREMISVFAEGHEEDIFGPESKNKRGEVKTQAYASCQRRLLLSTF